MKADIVFENHGSIFILRAASDAGGEWIEENVQQGEETQYFAGGIVVEPRYADAIAFGADADGLQVEVAG